MAGYEMMRLILAGVVLAGAPAAAQDKAQDKPQGKPAEAPSLTAKLQPYIQCVNRLSERAMQSQERYLSWAKPSGPTGRERIIYGTYTIYDTADCRKGVEAAAALAPQNAELEKAGAAYAEAAGALEPLLKEADDYYDQGDYKDDKMAKGKALHPRLMAAWKAFREADKGLRDVAQKLNDQAQRDELAALEQREGRKTRYLVMDVMLKAKDLSRVETGDPKSLDVPKVTEALGAYESAVVALEKYSTEHPDEKAGSVFLGSAKTFLTSAKKLMRRARDKVPYSQGDRMMLSSPGGGWMVEGSPQRLNRDFNQLVDRYNSGARF